MPLIMPLVYMSYSCTFNLKEPKSNRPTLIYLRAYFKNEGKYLKYSTGETIHPKHWNNENKFPERMAGRSNLAVQINSIITQLSRYSDTFQMICGRLELQGDAVSLAAVRKELNYEFKKNTLAPNSFFPVFDDFVKEKVDVGKITGGTINRYKNIKEVLEEFEKSSKYKLTFSSINEDFYIAFVKYSRKTLKHKDNTLGRNIGFIQTFMNWAGSKGLHHNYTFKRFEKPKSETDEIALSIEELDHLFEFDLSKKPSLERVRDVFIFGCTTGMRYSDFSKITSENIRNNHIYRNSQKQKNNLGIPLNKYSKSILEKYDYSLPKISSQKFREYIKDACQLAGFNKDTIKTTYRGSERIEEKLPMYKRISTHTARRTFITVSLDKGMRPEIVMSITGHKSYSSFKKYIKLTQSSRERAMQNTWN